MILSQPTLHYSSSSEFALPLLPDRISSLRVRIKSFASAYIVLSIYQCLTLDTGKSENWIGVRRSVLLWGTRIKVQWQRCHIPLGAGWVGRHNNRKNSHLGSSYRVSGIVLSPLNALARYIPTAPWSKSWPYFHYTEKNDILSPCWPKVTQLIHN